MRFIAVSLGLFIVTSSVSAIAGDSYQRKYGISYGGSTALSVRKQLNESILIYTGAGYTSIHSERNGSFSYTSNNEHYLITLGVRRYFSGSNLHSFIDLDITPNISSSEGYNSNVNNTRVYAAYGIEHFLSEHLSIEGKAGVSVNYAQSTYNGSTITHRYVNFPQSSLAVTYYW